MQEFVNGLNYWLNLINGVIWHDAVLYIVLGVGILFTLWSGFCQYHALTHGVQVTFGKYDNKDHPGAINHFQALSAALSATVGLGNIGGVALAISLGGPGAVFWMWMVGLAGMALKTTEVTLAMLYRDTSDPDNPSGGAMWVASRGLEKRGMGRLGKIVGVIFCLTLLVGGITGGNMFQAWNVAVITETYFPIPQAVVGVVLTVLVGMVILGGIKRIGAVAGRLVPLMCAIYLLAAFYVLAVHYAQIPEMLWLIVRSAFSPVEADQAFLGGTAGYAFLWGMKRALFSNEAGQGSSPIAHSAAKTNEPVREAVVAGLEPFIDTIVVCTVTTLVVLLSGAWNRGPEAIVAQPVQFVHPEQITLQGGEEFVGYRVSPPNAQPSVYLDLDAGSLDAPLRTLAEVEIAQSTPIMESWIPDFSVAPAKPADAERINGTWRLRDTIFVLYEGALDDNTGRNRHRLMGVIREVQLDGRDVPLIVWTPTKLESPPTMVLQEDGTVGLYNEFLGASLTGHAFDRVVPGMGRWIVTIACWLFAVSTIISWSYYCEQGVVFLVGQRGVLPFRIVYCLLIFVSCIGLIKTETELDNLSALGTGIMLWANIPIMLIFGGEAMRAYHTYMRKLKAGEFVGHEYPKITDVVEGHDVE